MRALGMVLVTLGVLLFGSLAGVMVLAGWVLASTSGARWLVDTLPQTGWMELEVKEIDGRLLGPLQLRDLHLVMPSLELRLDQATLEWSPARVLGGRLQINALRIGTLQVWTQAKDDEPDDEPAQIPQLPLGISIAQLSTSHLELHLPDTDTAQVADDIAAENLSWIGTALQIESLRARHASSGLVEVSAKADLLTQSIRVDQLMLQLEGAQPARIEARGRVHLDAQASQLDLRWRDLRWPLQGEEVQLSSRSGEARIEGQPQDLKLKAAFALGDTAQVQADAHYAAHAISARLDWTALSWPLAGEPRLSSAKGGVEVEGSPENYRYRLQAQLMAEGKVGVAQAVGSGSRTQLVLDTLKLVAARSEIEGSARVDWAQALNIDADLRLKNVDPGLIASDWPGRLNGRVQAHTQIEKDIPRAQFQIALKDSQLRGYPLQLDARGSAQDKTVDLSQLVLRTGSTRLQAQGRVTPPFSVQAKLDSPDLRALWPGLSGRAQLDARLQGSLDAPRLQANGEVNQLAYEATKIQRIRLDSELVLQGAWALDLHVTQVSGPLEAASVRMQVEGRNTDHRLSLRVDSEPAQADVQLVGAYDHARQKWNGALTRAQVQPTGLAQWSLEEAATIELSRATLQLQPACWSALASRLCVQAGRDQQRLRGAFRVEQLDFAYFASFLPPGWELLGGIDGTALAELRNGRLVEARADLATDPIRLSRDGQLLLQAERGSLRVEETAAATLAHVNLPLQNGRLTLDAQLAAGVAAFDARPLVANLQVDLQDLSFLRAFSEELREVSGRLEGGLAWTGTLASPQPAGQITLSDGRVQLATPGIELNPLRARISSQPDGSLLIDAQAESGGGQLDVDGRLQLSGEAAGLELAIRGENFQAANMSEARAWISPRLDVKLNAQRVDVRGEVDVPRADILPVSFASGIGPSSDQVIVTGDEVPGASSALQLFADVRVNLGEQVRFEGFGLKTRLSGSVRVIEAPGRAGSGSGEVRLIEGRYKAYGQDLDIKTGRLLFTGGPLTEPAVEIRAQRKPREDIEVGVFVRGKLDEPEFQLYSTPTLPREQQLSWLVLGRSIEDGGGDDERAMLANAALSLGLTGTDFLAQNVRGGLGLDEVSIGSSPGEDAQQARVTVGKYLSPKLYVSYGVGLFQPGQVFKLLYDLGRGFKFSTESGVQTGGDLLYSFERK
ncbi:MAG: translocation/assembly module TamB domain-containing protein [Panacagrimonas sp.]